MSNRNRVAQVPLNAGQLLGLLSGSLKVDPDGPQIPVDAELYLFADGDGLARTPTGRYHPNGWPENGPGIILGVRASNLPEVDEGTIMPVHPVRFISATNGGKPS